MYYLTGEASSVVVNVLAFDAKVASSIPPPVDPAGFLNLKSGYLARSELGKVQRGRALAPSPPKAMA